MTPWFSAAPSRVAEADEVDEWIRSGALPLTGQPDAAPLVPAGATASTLAWLGAELRRLSAPFDRVVDIDGPALLGERAAITAMGRRGSTSVGGSAHMVAAADGWIALNLARPEDHEMLPAWLGVSVEPGDWPAIRATISAQPSSVLVERASLLGLPIAVVGEHGSDQPSEPVRVVRAGAPLSTDGIDGRPVVLELASLWAGPLCGSLLAQVGFDVVKIEHPRRPDGARRGPAAFFDLLNAGKRSLALDLSAGGDRGIFDRLVQRAAVVIDGSRPRVARNLGIDVERIVGSGTLWLSITGHGRTGPGANRVAFGDDAAVAGGLVIPTAQSGGAPLFVADAAADPIAGLIGAVAVLAAWNDGVSALLDLGMAQAVAWAAGGGRRGGAPHPVPVSAEAAVPRARLPMGRAPAMSTDSETVRKALARHIT